MTTVLELQISPLHPDDGEYEVRVLKAAAGGEPTVSTRLDVEELLAQRTDLEVKVLASAAAARRVVPLSEQAMQDVGGRLFGALFTGPISGTYQASLGVARERQERLQIVLRMDADAPSLDLLPWEALFDAHDGAYLCRQWPIIRHLPASATPRPQPVELPLRILVAIAAPRGLPQLDTDAECRRLERALAPQIDAGEVELVWLTHASWESLQSQLLSGTWHVLHFIGHGCYDHVSKEGQLALEGDGGDAGQHLVEASFLVDLLREARPPLRLVVLNSCSSAQGSPDDRFSGVGAALVRDGVSAVAAMQFAVSDAASVRFAQGFYTALAHGRRVDDAVRSGRIAILGAGKSLEWITPVLYVRGEATSLFTLTAPPRRPEAPERAPSQQRAVDPGERDRLRALYALARAELRMGRPGEAVQLLDDLLVLDPKNADVAALREKAVGRQQLVELYGRAMQAEEAQDWSAAIDSYEQVLRREPDYGEAAARNAFCRERRNIADLQEELRIHADAGRWQAVLEVGEEIEELDHDAADPDGLVTRARREVEEAERAAELGRWYEQGLAAEGVGDWGAAVECFERVVGLEPGYRDAGERGESCRVRRRVADLQVTLREHADAGRWKEVLAVSEEISEFDQEAADPDGLVTRARREVEEAERAAELGRWYEQGLAAEGVGDWGAAVECFERVVGLEPGYRDAGERGESCRVRRRVADLQVTLREHADAGRWKEVLAVSEEISEFDQDAADPDGLAMRARQAVKEEQRAAGLEDLYTLARAAEEVEDWTTAVINYGRIDGWEPGYRDVAARSEVCRRRGRIAYLQQELRSHADAGRWQQVVDVSEEISGLDRSAADPDGLATYARQAVTAAQQADELQRWYVKALVAEEAGNWSTAIQIYDALIDGGEGYRDSVHRREVCVEQQRISEQAAAAEGSSPRRPTGVTDLAAPCGAIAWNPKWQVMAVNVRSDARIRIYDINAEEQLEVKAGDKWGPYAVAFSPDGTRFVGNFRQGCRIWDTQTGEKILQIRFPAVMASAAFSPDGTRLATGLYGYACIWDAETGKQVFQHRQRSVTSVSYSSSGRRLAVADQGGLWIWDTNTGRELFEDHRGFLNSVAFSPDGIHLATAGEDGVVRLWDIRGPVEEIGEIVHEYPVGAVAFSADGAFVAAGGEDYVARVWSVGDFELVFVVEHEHPVLSVIFSPDGDYVATGTSESVKVWPFQ
ncbi:CHAT domain-containing protein [Streptomyces sp. M41]|uniref:CHAT domain-containing protein n=1 Tax=Streptomyces sp. M41 TaxID=3059412 RepID=UPI00374CED3D